VNKLDVFSNQSRREFCACCSKAVGLLALGGAAGCGGSPTSPSSNSTPLTSVTGVVSGRVVTVAVGSGPLATVGGMAIAQTSIGSFLITRTAASSATVLTATCTHEGCTVTNFSGSQFVCPCHGSTYATSGSVVQGPANRPLSTFAAQLNGDTLTFTA
jgi:cytochrome b6-f complex iron-sulfur subunit